jgi:hypothetical protein
MNEPERLENHPTNGRPVRRTYLICVFAGPAIVGLLGAFLMAIAIFSTHRPPCGSPSCP